MGIPGGSVANQQLLLFQDPLSNGLRAFLVQHLLQAVGPVSGDRREPGIVIELLRPLLLHHDIANVLEHLRGPVLSRVQLK
ncbi:hypothetical protein SDC9_135504 [bioreactor metagenome]|uniref:Uncharacterized protein n=1 Tax=bioreactor metagenome TaxID=1076179 RepID=A0A645DGL8_9ZZZZ